MHILMGGLLNAYSFNVFYGTDALPASWAALKGMPEMDRYALFSVVLELPPADVDHFVDDHTHYMGLHMRNTKYMAAEVLDNREQAPLNA